MGSLAPPHWLTNPFLLEARGPINGGSAFVAIAHMAGRQQTGLFMDTGKKAHTKYDTSESWPCVCAHLVYAT